MRGHNVCPIDGAASIIIMFLLHGAARSGKFLVSGSIFFNPPPYAEKNHLNIATFFAFADGGI